MGISNSSTLARRAALLFCALTLSACNTLGLGSGSTPAPTPAAAPAPPPTPATVPIAGVLAGPLATDIDEADRRAAFVAQSDALAKGQRRAWRGPRTFGFIEPGPESPRAEGMCRDHSLTLYVQGRPRTGKGVACRETNETWRFVS